MSQSAPRVLFITTRFPLSEGHWSGVFIYRQARAIQKLGCEVSVLAPSAPGVAAQESFGSLPVHRFAYLPERARQIAYGGGIPANLKSKPWLWAGMPFFGLGLIRAATRLARQHDIIHAHWSFAGALASLDAVRGGKPLVVSFHGSDLAKKSGPYAAFARRAGRAADAVVVHSRDMRRRALASGVAEAKILLIPHGIDPDDYAPEKPRPGRGQLVAVGRLSQEKGFDVLLEALALLGGDTEFHLRIIGEGPAATQLKTKSERLGLTDRVTFTGALPQAQVREALNAAGALIVPSRREGFGVVALEGMAAALPIVGTAVGALPQLVEEGVTGHLCEPENAAALARAIEKVLGDRDRCRAMGEQARRLIRERYTPAAVNRPLADIYRDLLRA